MGFPALNFQKFSRGACPQTHLETTAKPIICVLRTHNRLLFRKLRLLKTLKKTPLEVYKSHTNASKLCVIMHHHSVRFYNGCNRFSFFFSPLAKWAESYKPCNLIHSGSKQRFPISDHGHSNHAKTIE